MNNTKQLDLTFEEAQMLVNILHLATIFKGLEIAKETLYFKEKLDNLFKDKTKEEIK